MPRSKRLERPETPRKGLQITPRIIGTLERIARFRFATKSQLARLDGGSEDVIARRLADLFEHGFIDRPEKQRHGYRVGENPPIAHAITRSGLQIVEDNTTLAIPHLDWSTKNRRAKPAFIEHTLATTDVVIAFLEDANRRGLTLFDHYDLLPMFPEITRAHVAAMHDLQTQFGELQDTDVFLTQLDHFLRRHPAQAPGLAPFRHWLLSRRSAQIQNCMNDADRLEKFGRAAGPSEAGIPFVQIKPETAVKWLQASSRDLVIALQPQR